MSVHVLLKFLTLTETSRPQLAYTAQPLINKLKAFLLELYEGFTFVASQMHINIKNCIFFIDILLNNHLLKCLALFGPMR
jgi:predicted nuclease of restriction endonuclease-like (RecB) superfamily